MHEWFCLSLLVPLSVNASTVKKFAFVKKDRRRNRLGHAKANKLVGLFHNLRLMARMNKTAYVEPAVGWLEDTDVKAGITKWGISNYK